MSIESYRLPVAIGDSSGVVFNNALFVFGGGSGKDFSDSIIRVDPVGGEATVVGRMPYASRGHQIVDLGSGSVLLIGGFNGQTRSDVHRIDLDSFNAVPLAPCPTSIAWFAAALLDGVVHILGGFTIPAGYLSNHYSYDLAADRWETNCDSVPRDIFPLGAFGANVLIARNGELVSVGGADSFDKSAGRATTLGVVARFLPKSGQWKKQPQGIYPREGSAAVKVGEQLLVIGGIEDGSETASVRIERLDLRSDEIVPAGKLATGRLTPVAGLVGNRLVVAGGVIRPLDQMTDTIETFDISEML